MTQYPDKTCTLDRLIRHKRSVQAAIAGKKTEQRRNGIYGYPGETFELEDTTFEIISLTHEPLKNMSEREAQSEGYENLAAYRDLIIRMHKGMEWDPEHLVWVHRFRKAPDPTVADRNK